MGMFMTLQDSQVQECLALLIVGFVAWRALFKPVSLRAAHPLSHWLLKRGRVKWAMRVRQYALQGGKR
jgi:hypothetical protein